MSQPWPACSSRYECCCCVVPTEAAAVPWLVGHVVDTHACPLPLRRRLQGRTETIRTVSEQSCAFVRAFLDGETDAATKLKLLRDACNRHTDYTRDAMTGKGIDRSAGPPYSLPVLSTAHSHTARHAPPPHLQASLRLVHCVCRQGHRLAVPQGCAVRALAPEHLPAGSSTRGGTICGGVESMQAATSPTCPLAWCGVCDCCVFIASPSNRPTGGTCATRRLTSAWVPAAGSAPCVTTDVRRVFLSSTPPPSPPLACT